MLLYRNLLDRAYDLVSLHVGRQERFKYPLPGENKISQMPYPRANKDNQIPTPCSASPPPQPPPPAGITFILQFVDFELIGA